MAFLRSSTTLLLSIRRIPQADERSCFADAGMDLEHDKAKFSLREPQFSTPKDSLRDPAFAYRGDIIVGDWGIKFSILKHLQFFVIPFAGSVNKDLEDVLPSAERNDGTPPSSYRRIHRNRGIFDVANFRLPKSVSHILSESHGRSLTQRYRYRLNFAESTSFRLCAELGPVSGYQYTT